MRRRGTLARRIIFNFLGAESHIRTGVAARRSSSYIGKQDVSILLLHYVGEEADNEWARMKCGLRREWLAVTSMFLGFLGLCAF